MQSDPVCRLGVSLSASPLLRWDPCTPFSESHCCEIFHHYDLEHWKSLYLIAIVSGPPSDQTDSSSTGLNKLSSLKFRPVLQQPRVQGTAQDFSCCLPLGSGLGFCLPPETRQSTCSQGTARGKKHPHNIYCTGACAMPCEAHACDRNWVPSPPVLQAWRKPHSISTTSLLSAAGMKDFLPESQPAGNNAEA